MTRRKMSGWRAGRLLAVAAALVVLTSAGATCVMAVGLVYQDGDDFVNLFPNDSSAINSGSAIGDDDKWGFRAFGAPHNGSAQIFESGGTANLVENSPEIFQVVTGLTPGNNYDFYAVFWSAEGSQSWTMRAGVAPGVHTLYNRLGPGTGLTANAVAGKPAAGAAWTTPPEIPLTTNSPRFNEGDRTMLIGFAGSAVADAQGEARVYLDDLPTEPGGGTGLRSWHDGVAYVAAATAVTLTASVNRTTGQVLLNNPTSEPFQIRSINISSASGALNAAAWNKITGSRDGSPGGDGSFDTHPWQVTAPTPPALPTFTTQLVEVEQAVGAGSGGTLAAGGSLNFGNIWQRTPFEDVSILLTMADGSTANILAPTYGNGAPVAPADLDGSGSPELNDFTTLLNNMHTNITTTTAAQGHTLGDINNDRLINFQDFQAFRMAYDAAHGAGAFEVLLAQVPEPGSVVLSALAVGALLGRSRRIRRTMCGALGLVVCLGLALQAHAVNLVSVDINDRESVEVGDTATGFQPWIMTGSTAASATPVTQVVGGYTVTIAPFDDGLDENTVTAGVQNTTGQFDDRDRATPVDAGSLTNGQLYDDLIFAGGSAGPTGGLDLTVSGGALLPNTVYSVSLYSFDSGSTPAPQPRTSAWLDGNNSNLTFANMSFQGGVLPANNDQYKYNGVARTDGAGQLLLRGRNTSPNAASGGTTIGVVLNGFEINTFAELTLVVDAGSGAMQIRNEQGGPLEMSYYEIRSAAGSLNTGGWTSFDEGEGGDPTGTGWDESPNVSANLLNEVNLQSVASIAAGGNRPLGNAFTPSGTQDLLFYYSTPTDLTLRAGLVKYQAGGDFDGDGDVDSTDFNHPTLGFKARFGVNLDGRDFLTWQRNYGTPAPGAAAGTGVPEPATGSLFAGAVAMALSRLRASRRRRSGGGRGGRL